MEYRITDEQAINQSNAQPSIDYYIANLNDNGEIENDDKAKILKVEVGMTVHFRLRRGCKVSREASLIVNKPINSQRRSALEEEEEQKIITTDTAYALDSRDSVHYTLTQPFDQIFPSQTLQDIRRSFDPIMEKVEGTAQQIRHSYSGGKLDEDYHEKVLQVDGIGQVNIEFRVKFEHAGSFFAQIEYFDQGLKAKNYSKPIYINVEPVLILRGHPIRCKELSIITVISRCLGTIEEDWEGMYDNISQLGYNAIHFTPIQQYGASYSHYSLADQTVIDDYFFTEHKLSKADRISILKSRVDYLKNEYGVLGIVDIVLNHTAYNSEWLIKHPESAYNTKDCPHLTSAYILDKALQDFSDDFATRKNMQDCPSAPFVRNEGDLRCVLNAIQQRVIKRLNLHEYFMLDIENTLLKVRNCIKNELSNQKALAKLEQIVNQQYRTQDAYALLNETFAINRGVEKSQVKLDIEIATAYFYLKNGKNEEKTIQALRPLLTKHNDEWRAKVQGFMKEAMGSFEGEIKYFKIELKNYEAGPYNKLIKPYFRELPNDERTKAVCNGWIMDAKPMEDFGMTGWHYLRRTVNIWGDSVKLRYGSCPADSPFLWEHMSTYVSDMAQVFDGFRLDNAHSTPIHVCNYLLQVARCNNPNLFVMAELFTSSAEADATFVRKLNINGLVREIQNSCNTKDLGNYFHQITCREAVLGRVDEEFENIVTSQKYKILKPSRPTEILYDCTHDNPTPMDKFKTGRMALSLLGVVSMADIPIASTWGQDQLVPYQINVVKEKRLYWRGQQDDLFAFDNEDPQMKRLSYQIRGITTHQEDISSLIEQPHYDIVQQQSKSDFEWEFIFNNGSAQSVTLAGTFNGWNKNSHSMRKDGRDKWVLKMTIPFIDGVTKHEFKFVVNDRDWLINSQLLTIRDSNGNVNNYFDVPSQDTSISIPSQQYQMCKENATEKIFTDIRYARKWMNRIHEECARNNAQIFLHQQATDVLVIIRQFNLDYSNEYDAYVSITRQCYYQEGGEYNYQTSIELPGLYTKTVFAAFIEINTAMDYRACETNPKYIQSASAKLRTFKSLQQFCRIENIPESNGARQRLVFFKMPPGFTCVIKTRCPQKMKDAVHNLNILNQFKSASNLSSQLFERASLAAFNHLLFRSDPEEKEISNGQRGPYGLEKYGQFTYAGISSFMTIYRGLKISGEMDNELFDNMRRGLWYLEYARDRLSFMGPELQSVVQYLAENINIIKVLDPSLRPKYGSRIIEKLYNSAVFEVAVVRMRDRFINTSVDDPFIQKLALSVLQQYGRVPSAQFYDHMDTLAAGLPHFSTGYTRCWGRDTFISLKGLLISTGLWQEAADVIVYFGRVLRHGGLIPNLHDRGNNTRFNARDAPLFFMQSIKDFYNEQCNAYGSSVNAQKFINDTKVDLHFKDQYDQQKHIQNQHSPAQQVSIAQLMHQILQSHASGIKFREWNAGPGIDSQMKNEGFNVDIYLDKETGFIHGGNQFNCGTWMDKMGSSTVTGNKGIPATPRDGAPIEIIAMLYSSLRFMQNLAEDRVISTTGVKIQGQDRQWTYQEWADKIQANFERCFWVPLKEQDDKNFVIDKKLVNRRGIYKDVFRPSAPYTEYQLRPNLCVAMSYAQELFENSHAQICLGNVETILMEEGCMGIKTLDPADKSYRGDYVNSDQSCGWNYHQGPEWLWPVGFFLKAKMIFLDYSSKEDAQEDIMKWLLPHQKHIQTSRWEGLPELTNSHGQYCPDSCTTQAWSIATILDALRDLHTQ